MRLYLLTLATILQRKSWVLCFLCVSALPFILPQISSATENPILIQPARIQAAWGTLWVCTLIWGLFTASNEGVSAVKSGIGEYFRTTGLNPTRQLFQIWLAVFTFVAPLALITLLISHLGALPSDPDQQGPWLVLNSQYVVLFLLVIAPLIALATALASRFGAITGFCATLLIVIYGLYGVGYLDNMLKLEPNPVLRSIWAYSPHYRYADLTQRLYFKSGPLPGHAFQLMSFYYLGIGTVVTVIAHLCFQTKSK